MVQGTQRGRRIKQAFQMYRHKNTHLTEGKKALPTPFVGIRNSAFLELSVWIFSYVRPAVLSFGGTDFCKT